MMDMAEEIVTQCALAVQGKLTIEYQVMMLLLSECMIEHQLLNKSNHVHVCINEGICINYLQGYLQCQIILFVLKKRACLLDFKLIISCSTL